MELISKTRINGPNLIQIARALSLGSFKKYVDVYTKDEKKFFADFATAFTKLQELGTVGLVDV